MDNTTIFHKILDGSISSGKVYETERVLGFKDINPRAPTHILFIAKQEEDFVASIADLSDSTSHVPLLLISAAQTFAKQNGIDGYQLKFHVGKGGGQEVFFLHLHFLSQEPIKE
ncbi:HIT domain-containing protein [Candidatus Peregrinibacteria bacterium]|jgi:histidine triad (HIT) family protein|nr:HIT domain-containing protein [Candidatus Peregrinibacteria bacterium]MBT3598606.1 HIT domain-containing protein [Candidatus Peregrinibacteria bacterium]MBT4367021.1 HIT domain-containing protein [Candidatus Peregrinibacteria bacterium]MBT4586126.1 HIT domain-containing protein [Candidatus Peregrinibacteria bacterium]MBT6730601.1 HIT domain-containing protein [Candidatus Peregrinibacteria bacterium]